MEDDFLNYMTRTDAAMADLLSRVSAMEQALTMLNGVTMQSDPSRLPTVVFENTPAEVEVVPNAAD